MVYSTLMALDIRSTGALAIVSSGQLENRVQLPNGFELVPSQSAEGAFYVVSLSSCTCPDSQYRKVTCKHQLAIRLQNVLDQVNGQQEEYPF
jgi:uncharacterized Zn finger protein